MILDQLDYSKEYKFLGPLFDQAFEYLKSFDPATAEGRYELNGNKLYSLVQTYNTAEPSERTFEAHQNYADIQFILSGREIIYYSRVSSLTVRAEYDTLKDATFFEDYDDRPLYLNSGDFVVLLPHDAHKPGCQWETSCKVRKVVIKILLREPADR